MNFKVKSFYHDDTYTWTHLVSCDNTQIAVLIDPVLDYNPNSSTSSTKFTDEILVYIRQHNIQLKYVLETHAHADHITSAAYIQEKTQADILIGEGIKSVQKTFKKVFNLAESFATDGSQFNDLLKDKDCINFGDCQLTVKHTPGHTDDSMSYIIDDCVFIGDTLFSPDYGSARCDFPGGDSAKLYDSVKAIYQLGKHKKLYLCHDYPPESRQPQAWFLSSEHQQHNKHLHTGVNKKSFVEMRKQRDSQLEKPRLIFPSVQINIDAGKFPAPEINGISYLKIPLRYL